MVQNIVRIRFCRRSMCIRFESFPNVKLRHQIERICGKIRSEEHTSELQSQSNLVCRLLLEKKKKTDVTDVPVHDAIIASALSARARAVLSATCQAQSTVSRPRRAVSSIDGVHYCGRVCTGS